MHVRKSEISRELSLLWEKCVGLGVFPFINTVRVFLDNLVAFTETASEHICSDSKTQL